MTASFIHEMSINALKQAYETGELDPATLCESIREKAKSLESHNIFIHLLTAAEQAIYIDGLKDKDPASSPLWGIPFAIKDNIDLANIPTTAGCEAFAYTPEASATVVQQLIDAGAIPVGKTNLDQFATGLNGTRSPWGACKNAFNPEYISGGSSSGSAVAVALGLATFSLGTDTAGSGRVPACFNNLVGLKPSRGLLSATGMVPACRSLDCMSIFAYSSDDANAVLSVAEGHDENDAYSRKNPYDNQPRHYGEHKGNLTLGIIPEESLSFFGDDAYSKAYQDTLKRLKESGVELVQIDYAPFEEAAKLLYEGPWVAERYIATESIMLNNPDAVFPVVRDIIQPGNNHNATALFKAQYRLNALKTICDKQLEALDALLTPTAGTCFTIDEMLEEPILRNSQLGYYTNFMNLLDLSSVAVPTQMTDKGLPFGITLVSDCFRDRALLSIARHFQSIFPLNQGASSYEVIQQENPSVSDNRFIDVLVCGAHLDGLPLNWQLKERGGKLKFTGQTAPVYRMYALAGGPPFRPGLIYDEDKGAAIDIEVWSVPSGEFGSFVAGIPAPLGIGKVKLADGSFVSGFICEPYGIEGAEDITHFGGWREYIKTL